LPFDQRASVTSTDARTDSVLRRSLSRKHGQHRFLLDVRIQVPISSTLLFGLVARDVVDDPPDRAGSRVES
jgi:hypothetical protein